MHRANAAQAPPIAAGRSTDIVTAALDYARRGWLVFRVHSVRNAHCSCGKQDCAHPGKHPATPHGFKDATSALDQVRLWWKARPDCNVGIRTGAGSGLIAFDVDPQHGGDTSLAKLIRQHGPLPHTATSRTGGGGRHYFFAHPGGFVKSRTGLWPGIDVRGDGGYIITPPSRHSSGRSYVWLVSPRTKLAPLPDWLVAQLRSESTVSRRTTYRQLLQLEQTGVAEGLRNDTLARLVGRWINLRLDEDEINRRSFMWNEKNKPPLEAWEVSKVIGSILYRARARESPEDRIRTVIMSRRLSPREESLMLGLVQFWRVTRLSSFTFYAPNVTLQRYSTVQSRRAIRDGLKILQQEKLITVDLSNRSPTTGNRIRAVTLTGEIAEILQETL